MQRLRSVPSRATALDLGVIDAPLLIFGGPYGNRQATEAVLARAAQLGIPPDRMICTGDVVAYCGEPQATVDLIRDAAIATVMGNCEESLGFDAADCGCGFAPGSACQVLADEWFAFAADRTDAAAKAWMRRLPRLITFRMAGARLGVVHGGVGEINRFIFPSTPAREKQAEIMAAGVDGVIAGHSGLPFTDIIDGRLWHNAGAIGMPANEGLARTWFSVLTPTGEGIGIGHHHLDYDHLAAAEAMRRAGLASGYSASLLDGLWCSEDVLPVAERRQRGIPIEPAPLHWRTAGLDGGRLFARG